MLTLTSAKLATVEELFQFKENKFTLPAFPGYTQDQWGIKAHNRPWIDMAGNFKKEEKIIEVGGAYSTLPEYLATKYKLEAWVGDDFGFLTGDSFWERWGNPKKYAKEHNMVKYVFEPFGRFSKKYPNNYFDKIFSVSTLEHISKNNIVDVFKDMNRCLKKGGVQLHTIDLSIPSLGKCYVNLATDLFSDLLPGRFLSEIRYWTKILKQSGIKISVEMPSSFDLLNRSILVESPDVVFKYYNPNGKSKAYNPGASLLLIIEDL